MTDLIPVSALGDETPRVVRYGALSLREDTGTGLASVALSRGQSTPAPFGLTLPGPGGWESGDGVAAFWIGPGQWMISGADQGGSDFAAEVRAASPGAAVTEQTDGWVVLDIASGAGADPIEGLLERLVNLPAAATAPGRATRTGLDHMSVFVIRRDTDSLAILGTRSAAESLWHAVSVAAQRVAGVST